MVKRILSYKSVRLRSKSGTEYSDDGLPALIDACYKGELIENILRMPPKIPISFHAALNLASDARYQAMKSGRSGHQRHESLWHYSHFVDFIAELGFHIELTGDEFESPATLEN